MDSLAADVFLHLARTIAMGQTLMTRRSETDKEYFLQDWFATLLMDAGYSLRAQGRNSTPDFLVAREGILEGYELKSLANARPDRNPDYPPCRTDVDFNSSIPCGRFVKRHHHRLPAGLTAVDGTMLRSFYFFALYEPRTPLQVEGIAFVLVDGDFLNNDLDLAEGHKNISEGGFGSYGDAYVRTRKMYRFPNPLTEPDFRHRTVLVIQQPEREIGENLRLLVVKQKTEVKSGIARRFYVYEAS